VNAISALFRIDGNPVFAAVRETWKSFLDADELGMIEKWEATDG